MDDSVQYNNLESSTSKFGIWISLIEHQDLRSSTDSNISTCLIHSKASVGDSEQICTSVLNLIFQQANVAGVVNLSKWRSESAIVFGLRHNFFENLPSQGTNEFLADGFGLASLILNWRLIIILLQTLMSELVPSYEHSKDSTPADKVLKKTPFDLQKKNVSRCTMRVLDVWRPIFAAWRPQRTA